MKKVDPFKGYGLDIYRYLEWREHIKDIIVNGHPDIKMKYEVRDRVDVLKNKLLDQEFKGLKYYPVLYTNRFDLQQDDHTGKTNEFHPEGEKAQLMIEGLFKLQQYSHYRDDHPLSKSAMFMRHREVIFYKKDAVDLAPIVQELLTAGENLKMLTKFKDLLKRLEGEIDLSREGRRIQLNQLWNITNGLIDVVDSHSNYVNDVRSKVDNVEDMLKNSPLPQIETIRESQDIIEGELRLIKENQTSPSDDTLKEILKEQKELNKKMDTRLEKLEEKERAIPHKYEGMTQFEQVTQVLKELGVATANAVHVKLGHLTLNNVRSYLTRLTNQGKASKVKRKGSLTHYVWEGEN